MGKKRNGIYKCLITKSYVGFYNSTLIQHFDLFKIKESAMNHNKCYVFMADNNNYFSIEFSS